MWNFVGVVLLYLASAQWQVLADEIFTTRPGNVTVLAGKTLNLTWHVSFTDEQIRLCAWQRRSTPSDGWLKFVGFDNNKRQRQNISVTHVGWEFLARDSAPCKDGIWRDDVTGDYAGIYQIEIYDRDDTLHTDIAYVRVVQPSKHKYNISINGASWESDLSQDLEKPLPIELKHSETIPLSVSVSWPSNISSSLIHEQEVDLDCQPSDSKGSSPYSCAADVAAFEVNNSASHLLVNIRSQIQGAESVVIRQNITWTQPKEVITAVDQSSGNPLATAFIILFVVALLIIIALILYWYFKIRKKLKEANDRIKEITDLEKANRELTAQLQAKCDELSKITSELRNTEDELKIATENDQKLETMVAAHKEEINNNEAKISNLNATINDQDCDIKVLEDELDKTNIEIGLLNAEVEKWKSERFSENNRELNKKNKEITDLYGKLRQKDQEYSSLQDKKWESDREITSLRIQIKEKDDKVKDQTQTLNEQRDKIHRLSSDLYQYRQSPAKSDRNSIRSDDSMELPQEEKFKNAQKAIEKMQTHIDACDQVVTDYDVENLIIEVENLRDDIITTREALDAKIRLVSSPVSKKYIEMNKHKTNLGKKLHDVEQILSHIRDEQTTVKDMKSKLEMYMESLTTPQSQYRNGTLSLDQARTELKEALGKIKSDSGKGDTIDAIRNSLKKHVESSDKSREKLKEIKSSCSQYLDDDGAVTTGGADNFGSATLGAGGRKPPGASTPGTGFSRYGRPYNQQKPSWK